MSSFADPSMSAPFEVRKSPLHGFGVFAGTSIKAGTVIFNEEPLLRLQSLTNKSDAVVCGGCYRFVGSLGLQLEFLVRKVNRLSSFEAGARFPQDQFLSEVVTCGFTCGELYCSEACRAMHWDRGHSVLCTGCVAEENANNSPLIAFKSYAVATNEIFLMVGDVFASIFTHASVQSATDVDAKIAAVIALIRPFTEYVHELWWNVAIAPEGTDADELANSLKEIVADAWSHLDALFNIRAQGLSSVLSQEFVARLIGMFEQNNVGIRLESPIAAFVRGLNCNSPAIEYIAEGAKAVLNAIEREAEGHWKDASECSSDCDDSACGSGCGEEDGGDADASADVTPQEYQHLPSCKEGSPCRELREILMNEGEDRIFPPLDGTGFYSTICHMNHSCDPNVIVKYNAIPEVGLVASVVALRDIELGAELQQSYIDASKDTETRQRELRDYGFICSCKKCSAL